MRSMRADVDPDAEIEAAMRWARQQQRARSLLWEGEREGARWSASLNGFGGLDIRHVNGDERAILIIPSTLAESFARFVAVLFPEAAMLGSTDPDAAYQPPAGNDTDFWGNYGVNGDHRMRPFEEYECPRCHLFFEARIPVCNHCGAAPATPTDGAPNERGE